jgi:hypothetical protein
LSISDVPTAPVRTDAVIGHERIIKRYSVCLGATAPNLSSQVGPDAYFGNREFPEVAYEAR